MSGATGKDTTQWRRLLKDLIVYSPDARSLRWFLLKAKVAREPERELCSTEVNAGTLKDRIQLFIVLHHTVYNEYNYAQQRSYS